MLRLVRGVVLALALACLCTANAVSVRTEETSLREQGKHPYTVKDLLSLQEVGRAIFAPDGESFAYEWLESRESAPNQGASWLNGSLGPQAKLLIRQVVENSIARELFPQEKESGYWFGAASPTGKRVAVYSLANQQLRAGVFDFETGRVRFFPFIPVCCRDVWTPIWLSEDELIYAATAAEEWSFTSVLGRVGLDRRIAQLRHAGFSGREASVTVMHSSATGLHEVDDYLSGALLKINLSTDETVSLCEGYFNNLRLSPDRRYLVALKLAGKIQTGPSEPAHGDPTHRTQLLVFDLAKRTNASIVPCPSCNIPLATVAWSAVGNLLSFVGYDLALGRTGTHLFQFSAEKGTLVQLDTEGFQFSCRLSFNGEGLPVALSEGRSLAYGRKRPSAVHTSFWPLSACKPTDRNDWFIVETRGESVNVTSQFSKVSGVMLGYSANGPLIQADGSAWRLDVTGKSHVLTRERDTDLTAVRLEAENGGWAAPIARPPYSSVVMESSANAFVVDTATATTTSQIQKPVGSGRVVAISSDLKRVLLRADADAGSTFTVARAEGGARTVFSANAHLSKVQPARRVQIRSSIQPGVDLSSCMLLPPEGSARVARAAIVFVYPDVPNGACLAANLRDFDPLNAELLAGHGYAVLVPATPMAVTQSADGPMHHITAVVSAAVDQAIKEGYIDPERIGLFGLSQGMRETLQIVTETNRFKAAFIGYGLSNLASAYGSMAMVRRLDVRSTVVPEAPRFETPGSANFMGGRPWERPSAYIANSPLFFADRIHTPLLIMNSDFDSFPISQSEEIFSALYRLKREATYVTYWGEGHGNWGAGNVKDAWRRLFAWFDSHLK